MRRKAVAVAAAAALAGAGTASAQSVGAVTSGKGAYILRDGSLYPAGPSVHLRNGDRLITRANGSATIAMENGWWHCALFIVTPNVAQYNSIDAFSILWS